MAYDPYSPFDPSQLTPNGPGARDPYAPGVGVTPGNGSLPPDPSRPGQGMFRQGFSLHNDGTYVENPNATGPATNQDYLNASGNDPSVLARMNPQERDAYLRAQQQNPANRGKDWSDNGAYDTYAVPLNAKYADDPNRADRVTGGIQEAQQIATNGWNGAADINKYHLGGDPAFAAQERARLMAKGEAMEGRAGPTIDTSTVTPWQGAAYTAGMGQVSAGASQAGQGAALAGLAANGGAGTGLQGQAGKGLLALGQMPAGPSAAELAMKRTADQANAAQASLAAGARGGNSGLALTNAAANQGNIGTNLAGQIGVQRASEDMANRQFSANALGSAAGVFGQQSGQQSNDAAAAASAYGGAGATMGGAGTTFGNQANTNAAIATNNASLEGQQRGRNDDMGFKYDAAGNQTITNQANMDMGYDKQRTDDYIRSRNEYGNPDNTGRGTLTGSAGGDKLVGYGVQAAGTATAMASDIRAKKNISPADAKISDAFRGADSTADAIRGAQYPGDVVTLPPIGQPPGQPVEKPSFLNRFGQSLMGTGAQMAASDVRSKRDIRDAGPAISGAFRRADQNAADIRNEYIDSYPEEMTGYNPPATPDQLQQFAAIDRAAELRRRAKVETPVFYDEKADVMRSPLEQIRANRVAAGTGEGYPMTPGYEYRYKDPSSPGARPGPQYGIMAQDLEKTPAGASVVGEKNGRKFVDPGRLSLLTAAEVAKQRRELDDLKKTDFAGVQPAMYPAGQDYGY